MHKICLQVGHWNIKNNSIVALRGSTGAPGEMETNKAVTFRAAELLRTRGFDVKVTDANANDDKTVTDVDWEMYLAVHCDADSSTLGAGFTDVPKPSTDLAHERSQHIADKIAEKFFPETGIPFRPERRQKSDGIMYYYMWKYLTGPTPCVLIEMGERQDPHDSVILADIERCAIALARGVCNAFNVPYDVAPPAEEMVKIPKKEYDTLKKENLELRGALDSQNKRIALIKAECQNKVKSLSDSINTL